VVLVDIGNTHFHVLKNNEIIHLKKINTFDDEVYYISVNEEKEKQLKKLNPTAFNLKDYVKFNTSYKGLGIDRIMACKSITDGVVVDAGSAVTIDVMENNIHLGGIIMPGILAFKEAYGKISKVLNLKPDEFEFLPNNTADALNAGSIGAVICMIEKVRGKKKVYLTGGDGKFLLKFIKNAEFIEDLVFRGMKKTLKEMERL
jgi:type III pantothenate kinase